MLCSSFTIFRWTSSKFLISKDRKFSKDRILSVNDRLRFENDINNIKSFFPSMIVNSQDRIDSAMIVDSWSLSFTLIFMIVYFTLQDRLPIQDRIPNHYDSPRSAYSCKYRIFKLNCSFISRMNLFSCSVGWKNPMRRISRRPSTREHASIWCWTNGKPAIGKSGFGMSKLNGRNRVP